MYTYRGKFGGHYISLYIKNIKQKLIESSLYPKQSAVKGQKFCFLYPYCQVIQYLVIQLRKYVELIFYF